MIIKISKKEIEDAVTAKYGKGDVTFNDDGSAEIDTAAAEKKDIGFGKRDEGEEVSE